VEGPEAALARLVRGSSHLHEAVVEGEGVPIGKRVQRKGGEGLRRIEKLIKHRNCCICIVITRVVMIETTVGFVTF
jgi:hypothetical protein